MFGYYVAGYRPPVGERNWYYAAALWVALAAFVGALFVSALDYIRSQFGGSKLARGAVAAVVLATLVGGAVWVWDDSVVGTMDRYAGSEGFGPGDGCGPGGYRGTGP